MENAFKEYGYNLVLGGSGTIGSAVIKELQSRNIPVKALELNKVVTGVETVNANLLDLSKFREVSKGASHIYLCVGLPYFSDVWEKNWPLIMKNTIEVCKFHNSNLIFFDNSYMYGPPPLSNPITENHEQNPISRKGNARKITTDILISSFEKGEVEGVIGRSADFYGPDTVNSSLYNVFLQNILKNQNPMWLGNPNVKHSFAYTKDNAKALVDLALDKSCYGQVWHLPVEGPVTIQEVLDIINNLMNSDYKINYLPRFMLKILKLFIPILKEAEEMVYQFDTPFIFSDEKFRKKFPHFETTSFYQGMKEMIESFNQKNFREHP